MSNHQIFKIKLKKNNNFVIYLFIKSLKKNLSN